jgi:hypothetical protein
VRSVVRIFTAAIDLAIGVASVTAAVVVIAFTVVVVSLHVWRSEPLPNDAIRGVRCHWNGPWLIARGMVANLSDQDATFIVESDVAVAGGRSVAPNETDSLSVRAGSARIWRWTSDNAPLRPGTRVTRCSATVLPPSRGEGDD